MTGERVRLYVIPGSSPSVCAQLMIEHKGIEYQRTDLIPVISRGVLRAMRFPEVTAPAMTVDGRRVQTLRPIAEELDRIHPHPPLLPSDPALRLVVEEADQFGFDALQTPLGRILWNALHRDHSSLRSYSQGARLGLPISIALLMAGPVAAAQARLWKAGDATVRNDLAALPEVLNQIDAWCEAGVLNGEQLNLADFRFAPSLRLAMTADDLRPLIAGRPAGDLAMRVVPNYPGRMPPILPPAWLEPLRGEAKPAPAI